MKPRLLALAVVLASCFVAFAITIYDWNTGDTSSSIWFEVWDQSAGVPNERKLNIDSIAAYVLTNGGDMSVSSLSTPSIVVTNEVAAGEFWVGPSSNKVYAIAAGTGVTLSTNGTDKVVTIAASAGIPDVRNTVWLRDDFIANTSAGELGWTGTAYGTGAAASGSSAEAGRPGIVALNGGSASASGVHFNLRTSSVDLGAGSVTFHYGVKSPAATSDGTESYTMWVGLHDSSTSAEPVDGVYFEYDQNNASIYGVCSSNSSRTKQSTSVNLAANTWYDLSAVVNAAGTSVGFYVNGTLATTITANIPTGASRIMGPQASMLRTTRTAVDRTCYLDYFSLDIALTSNRW